MVYELILNTIEDKRSYYAFRELESLRQTLLTQDKALSYKDLGAGSKVNVKNTRTVSNLAKHSLSPPKKMEFLFKLIKHKQPKVILELGTSLGLSALYMHKACSSSKLTTIEGIASIAEIAKYYFDYEKADIDLIHAAFDDALKLEKVKQSLYDVVYIDGNHTYDATIRYVEFFRSRLSDTGIIILDDIYWSKGMSDAWKKLSRNEDFAFSIDLFDYGLLIKKENQVEHQSFRIISRDKKPWSLGLWG